MIRNREAVSAGPAHEIVLDCLEAGIAGSEPSTSARSAIDRSGEVLTVGNKTYDLTEYDEVVVCGGGKAAVGIAETLEDVLGDRITGGVLVTKQPADLERIRVVVGNHPLPSSRNEAGTANLLDVLEVTDPRTLVLAVVTGGASSLLCAPAGQLTVADLRETTELLLDAGVSIGETNTVRKHLSEIKGGQLATLADPATVVGLVVSDVVGDNLSLIGSGPTVPDGSTYSDAVAVLERHGIDAPTAVTDHLWAGQRGEVPETPDQSNAAVRRVDNHLLCGGIAAIDAAEDAAVNAGYTPLVLTSRLRGEAAEVGTVLASVAEEVASGDGLATPPTVVLAGGECTVTVTGSGGEGGPNQELALSAARDIEESVVLGAIDTDGEDGSSVYAGALVDGSTVDDVTEANTYLQANDTGTYLKKREATIQTGPTGTNVNDLIVIAIPEER